jgi:hypothetical protein
MWGYTERQQGYLIKYPFILKNKEIRLKIKKAYQITLLHVCLCVPPNA